ncbi:MAG: hypothetical protein O7D30_06865 [Rickettsia endosymbiont of Ixodes persulcatus]|nr:hypothetical protein [Rickettsia endosymbiont of Ixodes persulcatus]
MFSISHLLKKNMFDVKQNTLYIFVYFNFIQLAFNNPNLDILICS